MDNWVPGLVFPFNITMVISMDEEFFTSYYSTLVVSRIILFLNFDFYFFKKSLNVMEFPKFFTETHNKRYFLMNSGMKLKVEFISLK